ncbi:1858_t:CDS:2 [Ambispora leptoticha]|uniref:Protein transport protein SFT2 n=1 Tax=Ambispora leptoticha TaxID=144679 RepID=A0A9N9CN91_9GLOM|nr:1858_t:CDS:2 [Ambispora leptoticha]
MKFWDSTGYGDQGTMDESSPFDGLFKLSRMERLYAFGICLNLPGFAILYTLGNIISLLSTGFLVGFKKQAKTMFAPVRWIASTVFFASMVATLVVAFTLYFGIAQVIYLMADPSLRKYVAVVLIVLYNGDMVFVILE